jgi:predicted YcjX-like family ATPase
MEDSDKLELVGDPKWFPEWAYPDQPFNRGACVASMRLEFTLYDVLLRDYNDRFYEYEDSIAAACAMAILNAGKSCVQEMARAALYHAYDLRG